jgi:hypothetical protein
MLDAARDIRPYPRQLGALPSRAELAGDLVRGVVLEEPATASVVAGRCSGSFHGSSNSAVGASAAISRLVIDAVLIPRPYGQEQLRPRAPVCSAIRPRTLLCVCPSCAVCASFASRQRIRSFHAEPTG